MMSDEVPGLDFLSCGVASLLHKLKHGQLPTMHERVLVVRASVVSELIKKNKAPLRKTSLLRLFAVLFIYRQWGEGGTEAAAREAVADKVAQSPSTLRTWRRGLRRALGRRHLKALEDLARSAGRSRAAPDRQPLPENPMARELADMTLSEFEFHYRKFKAPDKPNLYDYWRDNDPMNEMLYWAFACQELDKLRRAGNRKKSDYVMIVLDTKTALAISEARTLRTAE
jgi:hypothetical protein